MKITPKVIIDVAEALKVGATHRIAAQYAGMSERTFQKFLAIGRVHLDEGLESIEAQFAQAVEKAQAGGAVEDLKRIQKAAEAGTWQASGWRLERRWPNEYGRRISQVYVSEGEAPTDDLEQKSLDELYREMHALMADVSSG